MDSQLLERASQKMNELFFDVGMQKLYRETADQKKILLPDAYVVYNCNTGKGLSFVGRDYRLISNRRAVNLGRELFKELYPEVDPEELVPFRIVAPDSMAFAHIDLVHEKVDFSMFHQERWLPFLRISNSFNRSMALSFEIGFVRALCSNGCLFDSDLTKLRYIHTRDHKIALKSDLKPILKARQQFIQRCTLLKDWIIPEYCIVPLVLKVLNVEVPKTTKPIKRNCCFARLVEDIHELSRHYFRIMGVSAYAALNIMTDIVSHQEEYHNLPEYNSNARFYDSRAAVWMETITSEILKGHYDIRRELRKTVEQLEDLREKTGFEWENG